MPDPGSPQKTLGAKIRRATDEILKLLAEEACDTVYASVCAHARTYKAFPERLQWIPGIWIGGRRGQVLVADGKSVLWMAVGKHASQQIGSDKLALFSLASLELSKVQGDQLVTQPVSSDKF